MTKVKQAPWKSRIVGHGEEAPDQLLQQARLNGQSAGLNSLVAGEAEAEKVAQDISSLPVAIKRIGRRDVVDVQIAWFLRSLMAKLTGSAIPQNGRSPLAFPISRIFTFATPARAIGRIVDSLNCQCSALARAIVVFVLASYGWVNAVLFAALFARYNDRPFAMAKRRGTTERTKDMFALLSTALNQYSLSALFASKGLDSIGRTLGLLMLARAIHILKAEPVYAPTVHHDGLFAKSTSAWEQIVNTRCAGFPEMALHKTMSRMLDYAATAATA